MLDWNWDSRSLTFLDAGVVAEAFLHHEERLVDRTGWGRTPCRENKETKFVLKVF